jgi:acyl carrier protein
MPEAEQTIFDAIRRLLQRKQIEAEVTLDANIYDDLGLDSLDVAELSAILEDNLGSDPYNAGLNPLTAGAILAWYEK